MARPFAWEASYPPGLVWDVAPPQISLPEHLQRCVTAHGHRLFIDYRGVEISYAEFGRKVHQTAAGLMALGLQPGEKVALYLPNTPYHPFSFFGVLKAGGVVVHLSPLDAPRELVHKLSDSGARILITTNIGPMLEGAQKLLAGGFIDRLIVGDDAAYGPAPGLPIVAVPEGIPAIVNFNALFEAALPETWPVLEPTDLAVLQYTGGTTGLPKGAMHTHATLGASIAIYDQFYEGQTPEDKDEKLRVIAVLPFFHIYALVVLLLWQMKRGSALLLHLRFDAEAILRDIEVKRASYFPGVPTMWIALSTIPGIETRDFSSLKHVASGGAPLPVEVAARFERLVGKRIGGGWGMTETASAGTGHLMEGIFREDSVGVPLPGVEAQIVALDDPSRVLAVGETGELRVKGPNIFKGYYNKPVETAKDFVDGYFLTGDIGKMDADGMLYLVDRKKDMIISGGFNVYPRYIEDAIYEHPDVEECSVIGVVDNYRGQAAKAFIKLRTGAAEFSLDQLRAFLADKIGRHEMPSALEFRDALPKTPVGKLSKKELVAEEVAKLKDEAHG
ncbi:MAG TPA: AMP-binding protein [Acidocella sp.]|nr:MAG: dicarboxylate--CoA ligase PimA [Acidocella sp. 20-58-15]HQT38200.1 AMP-binding protein [Acidocella sp.]